MLELHQQPERETTFSNPLYEACAHPADVDECPDVKQEIWLYRPTAVTAALQYDRGVQHAPAAVHSRV